MPARGELVITCENCGHPNVFGRVDTKTFDAQQFVGTQAADLREVGKPVKPWQPRHRWPSWLAPGVLAGSGTAAVFMAVGVEKPLAVPFVTIPFMAFVFNQLEQARARRPRERKQSTTVRVSVDGGGGGGDDAIKEKLNFPGHIKVLETFAVEYASIGTSEAAWTGGGGKLTRAEYYMVRNWLMENHLAVWNSLKGKTQGWRVTAKGGAVLRGLAPPLRQDTRP
jgi:hypothetical protein